MTFFQPVPVVRSSDKKFSPGGRAEPFRGYSTGGRRGMPASNRRFGSQTDRLFTCTGDIHAKSEPC
jgi:hypothetical protein